MGARAGHHADVLYKFEDAGFDTTPTDTTFKVFGGNATLDTFEGSHEAVRVFNAERRAAEIVEQVFDGAWSVTCDLTEPPWWVQAIFGAPVSTNVAGALYDHVYEIETSNKPETLRLYLPTEGFSNYEMLPGCAVASVTFDQSQPNSPECTITGAYAREPVNQSTPATSIPNFAESTFLNRDAEVQINATTLGKAQNASVTIEAGTELINEIGSESAVDFVPKQFNPDMTYDHIVATAESVDILQRLRDGTSVTNHLKWDNGETGDAQYTVDIQVDGSVPNQYSETGRNDPEADLMEELQDMAEDVTFTITEDQASPPT